MLGKRKLYGEDCGWGLRGIWSFSQEGYNLTREPGETPLGHGHATNKNVFPQVWIPVGCSGEVEIRESEGGSKWIMYRFLMTSGKWIVELCTGSFGGRVIRCLCCGEYATNPMYCPKQSFEIYLFEWKAARMTRGRVFDLAKNQQNRLEAAVGC